MANGGDFNSVGIHCTRPSFFTLRIVSLLIVVSLAGCTTFQSSSTLIAAAAIIDKDNAIYVEINDHGVESALTSNTKIVGFSYDTTTMEKKFIEEHCRIDPIDIQHYKKYAAGNNSQEFSLNFKCRAKGEKLELYIPKNDEKWKLIAECSDRLIFGGDLVLVIAWHGGLACLEDWKGIDSPIDILDLELKKYRNNCKFHRDC